VFEDACTPVISKNNLRLGTTDCAVRNIYAPEIASHTVVAARQITHQPRLGSAKPLPIFPLTPWRLQPSLATGGATAPESRSISLGKAWPGTTNSAIRGTALHLAFRTHLTRPEFAPRLAKAIGLDADTLELVSERAKALKLLLSDMGFTDLRCEVPLLGHTPEGAEIPGMIDLLAIGPKGCMLIDYKSGGAGVGLGPYWPQLSAYVELVSQALPTSTVTTAGILWLDHGTLEMVGLQDVKPRSMELVSDQLLELPAYQGAFT
jgi:hypothetical protein